jgi:hypothetical protein
MRSRWLPIALLLAAILALVAAGCGGGGDDTTAPAETTAAEEPTVLTKAELISQGDAICGEVNAAVGAIGSSEEGDVAEQTEQVASLYVGMVENIRELGRPSETEGYGDFITAADELAEVEGEIKLATERGDVEVLGEAASAAAPILEEFQAQAAVYGFEECSEGPGAPPVTGTGSAPEGGGEVEEGGIEAAPEIEEEIAPEEVAPEVEEEVAPETGGAGGGVEEGVAPETGGGSEEGSPGGGIGPG